MSEEKEIKYYKERKANANLAYQEHHVAVIRACQNRYFQKKVFRKNKTPA